MKTVKIKSPLNNFIFLDVGIHFMHGIHFMKEKFYKL